jgi:uncharacterized protein
LLDHLPAPLGSGLRQRLGQLRELLVEQRAPRLVLVGRRGAGKSTLVNAIFDEPLAGIGHLGRGTLAPQWYAYHSTRGALEVLDTRGIGEAQLATEPNAREATLHAIVAECSAKPPDALLFLVKAKEIESRSDEDMRDLAEICSAIARKHGGRLPIIAVANQCDELSPPTVRLDRPEDNPRYHSKRQAVDIVEGKLSDRIAAHPSLVANWVNSVGVVSYAEWAADGSLLEDLRWRVEDLVRYVFLELPNQAQVELVRLSRVRGLQREVATRIIHATAAVCAALGAIPLPFADMTPITGAQIAMVTAIGHVSGRELSAKAASEFLFALGVNVGAGFVFRELARGLVKWAFPGGGSVVSAAVAYAATLGLGAAAVAYFIDNKSVAEAQTEYSKARADGERNYGGQSESDSG